jgi:hypothetical protein
MKAAIQLAGQLLVIAATSAYAAALPAQGATTAGDCTWQAVPTADTGWPHNAFYGVAAIASDDVWAVGAYGNLDIDAWPLIQHWDGTSWSQTPAPKLTIPHELLAVSAVSSDDVWAVGGYDSGGQALIEHWDGSAWSVVPHPNPGAFNRFHGVTAVSSGDVWAVGQSSDGGLSQTLIQHWNGTSWSVVPSPNVPGQHNKLNAVSAVPGSPNEVWAVGEAGPSALILQWNGVQWSLVPAASAGPVPILTGVVAIASDNVWAVGWTSAGAGPITLTQHWDGSTWSVVPSPNPGPTFNYLWGVAAVSTDDMWAVGYYVAPGTNGRTLMLRWNGSSWTHVPGHDSGPSGLQFRLNAASAIAGSDVWSVGTSSHSLAEHWDGSQWSISPTPNAGVGNNVLEAVSGSSPTHVWSVGHSVFGIERRTLVEQWDGEDWRIVPSPNTHKRLNELTGVAALSSSDAWAVGSAHSGNAPDQITLVLRWNGSSWAIVPSPSPGTAGHNQLHAVSASSPSNVWAVGSVMHSGGFIQPLVLRWSGAGWNVIPAASAPGEHSAFFGVVALAPDDVWAVGYRGFVEFATLIEHWDGSSWTIVPSPDPQVSSNILQAVSASGPDDVWAVGTSKNLFTSMTGGLIEHWDGSAWSLVNGAGAALYGVAAASPGNVWAVGDQAGLTWIGHFNGSAFESFPSPTLAGRLQAAAAISNATFHVVGQRHEEDGALRTLNEQFACDIEPYCFCDSGGICGNEDPSAGCANSTGSGSRLSQAGGSTSVAADDLVLGAVQVPPNTLGLYLMGGAATEAPLFDGRLCVAAGSEGLFRFQAGSSGPAGVLTLGPGIVADSQGFGPTGLVQVGSTWHFQAWYRDPGGPCGFGANLSNAARVTFQR